jgi:hypothetical protein
LHYKRFQKSIKKILKYLYFKLHRIHYFYKHSIPFFDKEIDKKRLVNFFELVGNIESAAIIGKGASIFKSTPLPEVKNCDFRFIMNSVDIINLEAFIGKDFDAQITTHVGRANSLMPVLSKKNIKKYGIKFLMCNNNISHKNGETILDYWRFFNNRVDKISYMPMPEEFSFYPEMSKYGERLTIASSLILLLYNIKTVKKIVFVGVDAFHFGYSDKENASSKHFYSMYYGGYDNPKKTHGEPFLFFLFDTLRIINEQRKLFVYFPEILKQYIDFPKESYICFYK